MGGCAWGARAKAFDRDPLATSKGVYTPQDYTVLLIVTDGVINDMV